MPPPEFLIIQPWPGQFRRRYRCTFGAGYSAWMIFFRTRLRKHVGRSVRRYRSLPQRQRHRLAPPPSVRVAHDLVQFVITHFRKMLNSFRELGEMRSRRINRQPPIRFFLRRRNFANRICRPAACKLLLIVRIAEKIEFLRLPRRQIFQIHFQPLCRSGHLGRESGRIIGQIKRFRSQHTRSLVIAVIFSDENHGDHQASGVLATEAFDLADDSTAFPAQVAGATKRLEVYLENLTPWQPKKLYFFSDADDQKQFAGSGPAYSIREVSPSQKKPYWRLAIDAATPHLTQFPEAIQHFSKMSDDELNKIMSDPNAGWWSEPMTLTLGKAAVPADRTADVFAQTRPEENHPGGIAGSKGASIPSAELAGPWLYYQEFRRRHGLTDMLEAKMPEIAVKAGSTLSVPIVIAHSPETGDEVNVNVSLPAGWKVLNGTGRLRLPAESRTALKVEISTPEMSKEELKGAQPVEVVVGVSGDGSSKSQVRLRVLVKASALPQ